MDGANGYFSASTNSVVLNTNLFKKSGNNTADVLDTLFHELQHGVQFIENFKDGLVSGVRGSNKSSIAKQGKDKLLIKLRERLIKATEEYDLLVPKPDVNDRLDITRMIKALSDPDIIKKQDELKQIIGDSNAKLKSRAFELYLKNLGEAESRVVGAQARPNSSRNQSFLSARSDQEKLQGEIKGTKRTGQDLVTENLMQNLLPFSTEKELSAVFGGKWDILLKRPNVT